MEEFTFPCVPPEQCNAKTLPFHHFASPTTPWLVAGSVNTTVHEHDHRRSVSAVEPQAAVCSDHYAMVAAGAGYQKHHGSARYAVEEDKMDMLWEDFNEELARAAPPCPLTKGTPWATTTESWLDGDEDFVPAEKRKHAVVRRKRMGLLTMLRLLKKLFLAHKSSSATASRKAPPI